MRDARPNWSRGKGSAEQPAAAAQPTPRPPPPHTHTTDSIINKLKSFQFNSVAEAATSHSRRGGSESRCFVMELFKMEVELLSDTFSRSGDTFKLFNFSTLVMYPTPSCSSGGAI